MFLTFDLDWASDFVIEYTLDILNKYDVPSTWFITHDSPIIERLRNDDRIELGIHPNFNTLLDSTDATGQTSTTVIKEILEIVPEATAVRSHSLTTGSRLKAKFKEFGLTHHCNFLIPFSSRIQLLPYWDYYDLIEVPHLWEDDTHTHLSNRDTLPHLVQTTLPVFDFHPIHIFLNSYDIASYEASRSIQGSSIEKERLIEFQNKDFGTKDCLVSLIEAIQEVTNM